MAEDRKLKPASQTARAEIRTNSVPVCWQCGQPGAVQYDQVVDRLHGVSGIWSIRYCSACRLAWLDPQPIPADLGLAYVSGYFTHDDSEERFYLGNTPLMRALRGMVMSGRYGYSAFRPNLPLADTLGRMLSLVPEVNRRATNRLLNAVLPWLPGGKILDIGCGNGFYLGMMKQLGWQVHGIEPDPEAAAVATRATGATVWSGPIEAVDAPQEYFDAVATMHVLEHAYNPQVFLNLAARFLRPGGLMYLLTPNYDSLGRRRFGKDWYNLDPPRHLNLVTPSALRRMCETTGLLKVRSLRSLWRRAPLDIKHAYAVRKTGNFCGKFAPSAGDRIAFSAYDKIEWAGNRLLDWGEEIELIAVRC